MSGHRELLQRLAAVAGDLPSGDVEKIACQLEALPPNADALKVAACVAAAEARAALTGLLATSTRDGLLPSALAWAVRAAHAATAYERARRKVELVWTGPTPIDPRTRRTDVALLELIESARSSLLVVSYVAYDVELVREALLAAVRRGVRITLVLEDPDASDGKIKFSGLLALGREVSATAHVYVWPLDRRPRDLAGRPGALHVKVAVADRERLLLSSANLTGHALSVNMELGILIDGDGHASKVVEHFERLIGEGVLVAADDGR